MNDILTSTDLWLGIAFLCSVVILNTYVMRRYHISGMPKGLMLPISMMTGIVVVATYHGLL